jgi:hypothetical protein
MTRQTHQRLISEEDLVQDFGAVVFKNEFSVVRIKTAKIKDGWRTRVTIHGVDGHGIELLPLGYMLGKNMLWFDNI